MSFWKKLFGFKKSPKTDIDDREPTQPTDVSNIHDAVKCEDLKLIKAMVKAKSDLVYSRDEYGNTPLHYAAGRDCKDIVTFLLAKGADVNAKGNFGTPLHYAASDGHVNMTQLLFGQRGDCQCNRQKRLDTLSPCGGD